MPLPRATRVVIMLLLSVSAALARTPGTLWIIAIVRPSVLFSGAAPDGASFSQGGDASASAAIVVLPAAEAQSFSTSAVVANNPNSTGYDLAAKLASPGTALIDGIELSEKEIVIASQAPYGVPLVHSITVSGHAAVSITLTCRPR